MPRNTRDKNQNTRWSAEGSQYIEYLLPESQTINYVGISFFRGDIRKANFKILVSNNGGDYATVFDGSSSGNITDIEKFYFDTKTVDKIRIEGSGNSTDSWNSYNEVEWGQETVPASTPTYRYYSGFENSTERADWTGYNRNLSHAATGLGMTGSYVSRIA